ncbi:MAG: 3'-5' exonuclease [Candidatus Sumerlaeota bacterium]|nr:3'-5' exonuclease [Candidatus Sumerlaeota bacterium]
MNLTLDRPLIVFDLETTGLGDPIRIVQLAAVKITPDGSREERMKLFNPGRTIEPEAIRVHGITDERVAREPPFAAYAKGMAAFFSGCWLAGFNVQKYDFAILVREFERAGVENDLTRDRVIDVKTLYHHFFPRNLSAAYKDYCGAELEGAHDAMSDARAAAEILFRQIERHQLPSDPAGLVAFLKSLERERSSQSPLQGGRLRVEGSETIINFGKHRGKSLSWMAINERGYLEWIIGGDFTEDIKTAVRKYL